MKINTKIILNHQDTLNKINRIAYQIIERHYEVDELIIAGIEAKGYQLAELLANVIEKAQSSKKISLIKININKKQPINNVSISSDLNRLESKHIVVVDDVLNSGKTLIYAVNYLLKCETNSISTAVLVDRSHKKYPVKADFKGLSLSTSMNNHVEVDLSNKQNYFTTLS
ncbi:phosphoribosyltransferase family protein [Psychroflexus sp. ALD_RP9]|uniref:phosphoribosyltransferase family protein n=1 Tax=Psychroflexus sp. ALD_RP9 TaxID=2777186 RepID=UPI001A8D9E29|nr:phosphoribosyltransferase family protein [Psychroflexus sp. ALD_RP9]QSS97611.1 phosphoribosyltransferase [Psychroflexus sp. ALD_RP9]